jgi:hypothetical protein
MVRAGRRGGAGLQQGPVVSQFDTIPVCTILVLMKNVTLSADEELIEQARDWARLQKSTLNSLFRQWLSDLVKQKESEERLRALELRIGYARSGGKFSREEMNAR